MKLVVAACLHKHGKHTEENEMKKFRKNVIIVNNEFDYDKLAEAIVKAAAKQQEQYSPSREWMKYILIPIFWGVAILSGILAVAMFISLCQNITSVFESGTLAEIVAFLFEFLISFFTAGFCVFSIITAKEIDKENDRSYVASMFSNIVAIAALIVALVALLKGVG